MTETWYDRNLVMGESPRPRGFVSRSVPGDVEVSVRLKSLSWNVGGPNTYSNDIRPATASGLMIRKSLTTNCGRFLLKQLEPRRMP